LLTKTLLISSCSVNPSDTGSPDTAQGFGHSEP